MSKHTPGPWTVDESGNIRCDPDDNDYGSRDSMSEFKATDFDAANLEGGA